MGIADEVREFVDGADGYEIWRPQHMTALIEIANRIDAKHESSCKEQYARGVKDGTRVRVNELMVRDHGYVELPKDADGVPICVGDDMESVNAPHMHGPVEYVALTESGWEVDGEPPKNLRHHATDTWERIIEDAREYILNIGGSYLWKNKSDELVARCKALAGGENS